MPTDWKAILPTLKADAQAGLGIQAIALKHGLPKGSVHRWLNKPETSETDTAVSAKLDAPASVKPLDGTLQSGTVSPKLSELASPIALQAEVSALETARNEARTALADIAAGRRTGDASQMAALRLLLKDELEPETERNLYAGRSTDELAERSLILAVSVLGIRRVSAKLRELGQSETLDLGLDWEPTATELRAEAVTREAAYVSAGDTVDEPTARAVTVEAVRPLESVARVGVSADGLGGVESIG